MLTPRCAALLVLLIAVSCMLPWAEAKGQAYGARGIGSRGMIGGSGFYFFPIYYGGHYHGSRTHYNTPDGRRYSPGYGGWEKAGGWHAVDNMTHNATCGKNTTASPSCPCPMPSEAATKKWVWVQMTTSKRMCALCGGAAAGQPDVNGTDSVTFEVDAFMEIASRMPCTPPTTVLALKICTQTSWKKVTGGLADDQLGDKKICEVVGADTSSMPGASTRRQLMQSASSAGPPYYVVQFVVGATSEAHGNALHAAIKDSLNNPNSTLRNLYNVTSTLSVETETPFPWATVGAVIGILVASCFACCFLGVCCVFFASCFESCCDFCSANNPFKSEPADMSSPYQREDTFDPGSHLYYEQERAEAITRSRSNSPASQSFNQADLGASRSSFKLPIERSPTPPVADIAAPFDRSVSLDRSLSGQGRVQLGHASGAVPSPYTQAVVPSPYTQAVVQSPYTQAVNPYAASGPVNPYAAPPPPVTMPGQMRFERYSTPPRQTPPTQPLGRTASFPGRRASFDL